MPPRKRNANAKAACGLNKLVNLDKSAQASDECAPEFLSAPIKSQAALIRLFGEFVKASEPNALNLTARQTQNQASKQNSAMGGENL